MIRFSPIGCVLLVVTILCRLPLGETTGTIITDWRIRNHDVTPVLGRGYSIATGNLQSSCLEVTEQTTPSYDYDYYFTEVTSEDEKMSSLSGKITASFSYLWAKGNIHADYKKDKKSTKKTHHLIATMRTDRYYASVDEVKSKLSPDALNSP